MPYNITLGRSPLRGIPANSAISSKGTKKKKKEKELAQRWEATTAERSTHDATGPCTATERQEKKTNGGAGRTSRVAQCQVDPCASQMCRAGAFHVWLGGLAGRLRFTCSVKHARGLLGSACEGDLARELFFANAS